MSSVFKYLKKWFATSKYVIRHPRRFYVDMPTTGTLKEPLVFAMVSIFAASIFGTLALPVMLFPRDIISWVSSISLHDDMYLILLILSGLFLYNFISAAFQLFINAGIYHILLMVMGAKGSFDSTLRVSCYYYAVWLIAVPAIMSATMAIFIVENFGSLFSNILIGLDLLIIFTIVAYSFYMLFVGFTVVHKISMKRVVTGVIGIPSVFMIILIGFALVVGFISETSGGMGPPPYGEFPRQPYYSDAGSKILASRGSPPVIDGLITPDDMWEETQQIEFISADVPYTIAAKHDLENLYILIKCEGGPQWIYSRSLYFEQDGDTHDHDLYTGRNDEKYNGAVQYGPDNLADAHYPDGVDYTDGFSYEDGMVRGKYSDGSWVQEWVIPLQSGDENDIYVDKFPTTLGFAIIPWEGEGSWPYRALQYRPETWGDLELLA